VSGASSLKRLDDKLATGMSITDVANARWLTSVEVLTYLDQASECNYCDYPMMKGPPTTPPYSGTLLLYDSVETPTYANDGIDWISDPGVKFKSIERVMAKMADSESSGSDGRSRSSSSEWSGSMLSGASAEYLSCATRNTFHRREYRGPNNIRLLHYLDSMRAVRMTSELVDRIVMLSADADVQGGRAPNVAGAPKVGERKTHGHGRHTSEIPIQMDLGDAMKILGEMVDERDAAGTVLAEAMDEHVFKATTDAAYSAVMKHISPNEALGVVDAIEIEMAMEDDIMMSNEDEFSEIEDVTAFDIDEAINQVLTGTSDSNPDEDNGNGNKDGSHGELGSAYKGSVNSYGSGGTEGKGKAEIIEDRILDSLEEALPEELRLKLINTTEVMLDAAGVSLKSGKGLKIDHHNAETKQSFTVPPGAPHSIGSPTSHKKVGHALPEIIDVTPGFHVNGYHPLSSTEGKRKESKMHSHSIVITTKSPIPGLPPFVDQYYKWEQFAAFVDFQQVANDPQVRNISFNRVTHLTPFSYKVNTPTDIPYFSIRNIVLVGVLLPKDHRVKRNLRGIELALKLTLQTEWSAAADLIGALQTKEARLNTPLIKGIRRPKFIAPCGGMRMQLLSQISKIKFTMYPASSLPKSLANAMSSEAAPNFLQRVACASNERSQLGVESKRKRENYLEEWADTTGNDATMTTAEVDKHRKVRFVERIANATTPAEGKSGVPMEGNKTEPNGKDTDDMNEEELDNLLGTVLMRYVQDCIERCTTQAELLSEINWSGYAGLSLLHHAAFYNFMALITSLLNNGADTNILSSEGGFTPIHFAAAAGHKDVVDVLLRNGCNPIPMDSNQETPADHARKAGHLEIAAMLSAYNEQAGIMAQEGSNENMDTANNPSKTTDIFLQAAFKEISLKDKLGLNLFADRSKAAPIAFVQQTSTSMVMGGDGDEQCLGNTAFSFISQEDRAKLREAMSLANEMDLKEMNYISEHQSVRQYLRQSNYEAISAASQALEKANRKESDILKNAAQTRNSDPSKMQLSRALAMLVLRKNLPTA